jgi:hypothetical protein
MISRREIIKVCGLAAVSTELAFLCGHESRATEKPSDLVTEAQKGDPTDADEFVTFSPSAIREMVAKNGKAAFEPWQEGLHLSMVSTARQFIGKSRKSNPDTIANFLKLFGLPLKTDNGKDVAFCAAGVSYCALWAYSEALRRSLNDTNKFKELRKLMPDLEFYYFYPTVSCIDMYHIAAGKRRWIDHKVEPRIVPKPGWIALFDWAGVNIPDHCGLVQQASEDKMLTLEFNTSEGTGSQKNGGTVAERSRTYQHVYGFIVTDRKPVKGFEVMGAQGKSEPM